MGEHFQVALHPILDKVFLNVFHSLLCSGRIDGLFCTAAADLVAYQGVNELTGGASMLQEEK